MTEPVSTPPQTTDTPAAERLAWRAPVITVAPCRDALIFGAGAVDGPTSS